MLSQAVGGGVTEFRAPHWALVGVVARFETKGEGYPSPRWGRYPVLSWPGVYHSLSGGTPVLSWPVGILQSCPEKGYPCPGVSPTWDWGTSPCQDWCTPYLPERTWDLIPGKEPGTGVPNPGVDGHTPVKTLPSASYGCEDRTAELALTQEDFLVLRMILLHILIKDNLNWSGCYLLGFLSLTKYMTGLSFLEFVISSEIGHKFCKMHLHPCLVFETYSDWQLTTFCLWTRTLNKNTTLKFSTESWNLSFLSSMWYNCMSLQILSSQIFFKF